MPKGDGILGYTENLLERLYILSSLRMLQGPQEELKRVTI